MDYTNKAKRILFQIDYLTPFDVCEIIEKVQHICFQDEEALKEYIKEQITEIITDEYILEMELKKI